MNRCKHCTKVLPVTRVRRTFIEKNITKKQQFKYQCDKCNKITFITHSYLG